MMNGVGSSRTPKAIQELMRHADLSMTARYTHLSPAARESAVRLLDQDDLSRVVQAVAASPSPR